MRTTDRTATAIDRTVMGDSRPDKTRPTTDNGMVTTATTMKIAATENGGDDNRTDPKVR